jgi:anti-sigma factor RsiW
MAVQYKNEAMCRSTQSKLSEYVDSTLSARDMWEVEKHLADCAECSLVAHRTREMVNVLHNAATYDAGDEFMAKLHARLDTLGPVPAHRTPIAAAREWILDMRQRLNARPIPALSLGMASFILAALLFGGKPGAITVVNSNTTERVSQEALDRHVAVTASDPFDDPVAAKLEADSNGTDTGIHSGTD